MLGTPLGPRHRGARRRALPRPQTRAALDYPLLIDLLIIENIDLIFALDSFPAIFAITLDPFIVFSSNVFAIRGLRSLYFLVGGSVQRFAYPQYELAAVLIYVGVKMLVAGVYEMPVAVSLVVIAALLAVSVGVSLFLAPRPARRGVEAKAIRDQSAGYERLLLQERCARANLPPFPATAGRQRLLQ